MWFSYSANSATYIINNCIQSGVQDKILSFALDGNDHAIDSLLRPLCVDGFIAEAASHAWGAELLQPRMTLVAYVGVTPCLESGTVLIERYTGADRIVKKAGGPYRIDLRIAPVVFKLAHCQGGHDGPVREVELSS